MVEPHLRSGQLATGKWLPHCVGKISPSLGLGWSKVAAAAKTKGLWQQWLLSEALLTGTTAACEEGSERSLVLRRKKTEHSSSWHHGAPADRQAHLFPPGQGF